MNRSRTGATLAALVLIVAMITVGSDAAGGALASDPCDREDARQALALPDEPGPGGYFNDTSGIYYVTEPSTSYTRIHIGPAKLYILELDDQGSIAGRLTVYEGFQAVWIDSPKVETLVTTAGSTLTTLCTGSGADELDLDRSGRQLYVDTGAGADSILGTDHDDIIIAGTGDDLLAGGPGDDYLDGGDGADEIDGGPDTDECGSTGEMLDPRFPSIASDSIENCELEFKARRP